MARYTKSEAREWVRAEMKGVCNVVIPSYTADLRGLNEAGIRHDVRREIELGFKSLARHTSRVDELPTREQIALFYRCFRISHDA